MSKEETQKKNISKNGSMGGEGKNEKKMNKNRKKRN